MLPLPESHTTSFSKGRLIFQHIYLNWFFGLRIGQRPYRDNKLDKSKIILIKLERFCERKRSLVGGRLVVFDQVLFGPLFFVLEMVLGRSQASDALLSSVKQAIKLVNLIDTHTHVRRRSSL